MPDTKSPIKLYALSTCSHCMRTKKFLKDCNAEVMIIDVDLLVGEERSRVINEVKKHNPDLSFPTIIIGDRVIVGFNELKLKEALGIK